MDTTRWLDEREMRAWHGFLLMRRHLDVRINQRLLHSAGLSTADYELLVPLSESRERQMRALELRRMVGWEKSRLSHHLRRMEQRGLVQRVECPVDGRGADIRLTAEGLRAIESAAPDHVATVRRHFIDVMTEEELEMLVRLADRVLDTMREPLGPPPHEGGDCPPPVPAPDGECGPPA